MSQNDLKVTNKLKYFCKKVHRKNIPKIDNIDLKYKGCPIISETALCKDRECNLSANHDVVHISQAITDKRSHQ